jgi:hypothetical protein
VGASGDVLGRVDSDLALGFVETNKDRGLGLLDHEVTLETIGHGTSDVLDRGHHRAVRTRHRLRMSTGVSAHTGERGVCSAHPP